MVGGATGTWGAVGSQTMYCSDCHGDSATDAYAQGPHGSATGYILKGTWNPAVATLNTAATEASLCTQCHVLTGTAPNRAHASNNHKSRPCSACHIVVPHGGKVPRLIATTGAPERYTSTVAPPGIINFTFPLAATQTKQSCATVPTCHSTGGGGGGGTPGGPWSW
jgi:formate-dependent nitrite reductase cytochrome c552 subunit